MAGGYMGKILKVNLSEGSIKELPIDEEIAKKYLGGKGYAVRLLYDYLVEYEKLGIAPEDIDRLGRRTS